MNPGFTMTFADSDLEYYARSARTQFKEAAAVAFDTRQDKWGDTEFDHEFAYAVDSIHKIVNELHMNIRP